MSGNGKDIDIAWLNQGLASADPGAALTALRDFLVRSSRGQGVSRDVADDLVQEAALAIWQSVRNGTRIDRVGFLFTVLHNKRMDHFRRVKRQGDLEDQLATAMPPAAAQHGAGSALDAQEVQAAFARLRERAVADRQPQLRDKLRRDTEEVWQLATGQLEMAALIAAEQRAAGAKLAFVTARDRLQKRHQYAREALRRALDALVAENEIHNDHRQLYELILQCLLRRQKRGGRAS